nr:hypothetical protein [Nonlabens ulvanivorans]
MSMSDCDAGGEGATSCSISGQVEILGTGTEVAMSVSCGDGYYACCNSDWLTTAKCIKNGAKPSTSLIGPVQG